MQPANPYFATRTQCPVCTGTDMSPVYKRSYQDPWMQEYIRLEYRGHMETQYLEGLDYEIAECGRCGFLFQLHAPNDAGVQRVFDRWIEPAFAEQSIAENTFNRYLAQAMLTFATRHLRRPCLRVLDYGAGYGNLCAFARDAGHEVAALEIGTACRDTLRRRGFDPLSPGEEPPRQYDLVVCSQVIEHVPDPCRIVQAIHRTLKDDGLVALGVHDCRHIKRTLATVDALPIERYKLALAPCAAVQHMNCFTNATLKRLCLRAGLVPVFRPVLFLRYGLGGTHPKEILKNLARPFYRHFFSTSLFLRKA